MQPLTGFIQHDFTSYDEKGIRECKCGVAVDGRTVNNLQFADDIDLVSQSPQQLQELKTEVNKNSKRFGLRIDKHKTK